MTALEALAQREATVQYDRARRKHERNALIDARENRPLMSARERKAALRLARYGPSETLVVRPVEP